MVDRLSKAQQVIESLRAEHRAIRELLDRLSIALPAERVDLSRQLGVAIRLHCTLEAGVFFPALAGADKTIDILESIGGKYAGVIALLNELAIAPSAGHRRQIIEELRLLVIEHINVMEADDGFFARAERVELDWAALERDLMARRIQLQRMINEGSLRVSSRYFSGVTLRH